MFHVGDKEASAYLLDTWRVSKRLQFNLGIRQDWDQSLGDVAWSPRVAFSWSPFASGRTRISGGYAITHDAVTLAMLGLPLDQTAVTTQYNPNGAPTGPPALTTYTIPNAGLVLPRANNWTLGVDHQLTEHVYLTAKYLRRRGTDGFAFINTLAPDAPPSLLPLPNGDTGGIYQLTNLRPRRLRLGADLGAPNFFRAVRVDGVVYLVASALERGDRSQLGPAVAGDCPNLVPMPWDAPNRFLAWTYLPLPWKNWAISALADLRSGFPFSVRDPSGDCDRRGRFLSLSAEFRSEHRDRTHDHAARLPVRAARRRGQHHQPSQSRPR